MLIEFTQATKTTTGLCHLGFNANDGKGQVVQRGVFQRDGHVIWAMPIKCRNENFLGQFAHVPVRALTQFLNSSFLFEEHGNYSFMRARRYEGLPVLTVRATSKADLRVSGQALNLVSLTR